MSDLNVLWQPIVVGGLEIPNRVVVSPHGTGLTGAPYAAYLAKRARGGAGLLITGAQAVHPSSEIGLAMNGWLPTVIDELRQAADAVHAEGRPLFVQIFHIGAQDPGMRTVEHRGLVMSPSGDPSPEFGTIPKVMERREIEDVVEGFATTAQHAREAGADGVEVHGAHGYLLHAFLSPLTNRRSDEYGGSTANRARMALEIGEAVRRRCGRDFVVGMKLTFDEFAGPNGITPQEAEATLRALHESGLFDYFSLSAGNYGSFHRLVVPASSDLSGHTAAYGEIARRAIDEQVPVLVTGTIRTIAHAAEIVERGQADLVGMLRAHIADPDIVRKARAGRAQEIRRCVGANQGCWRRLRQAGVISCTVNPDTGRETTWRTDTATEAATGRRVLVIGGGPAGMKAAETAAIDGHEVTLVERAERLGGQVRFAGMLPHRGTWTHLVEDLSGSLERLGVDVRLNTAMTAPDAQGFGADVTFVATGSAWDTSGHSVHRPEHCGIPRTSDSHVIDPVTAIRDTASCGRRVILVDDLGTYLPLGLAEKLTLSGRRVTIVTASAAVGRNLGPEMTADLGWAYPRLVDAGVDILTSSHLERIEAGRVVVGSRWGTSTTELPADTVVLVMLREPDDALYHQLCGDGRDVRRIGDCVAPREVDDALFEAVREGQAV